MKNLSTLNPISRLACFFAAIALSAPPAGNLALAAGHESQSATVSTFATGLNNPRGLKFGPDGNLYVAEGGLGGPMMTTPAECQQAAGVGPYSGGFTARISRINPGGIRTTVVDNLPSSQTTPETGSLVSGVADVTFIGDQLYALLAGAGCSHGLLDTVNAILRVNGDGTTTQVADLSHFVKANPVANPDPDDFEPDGTWYSMVAVRGDLYAVEPNHQEVDRISPTTGEIRRVVDISASFPPPTNESRSWVGPTSMIYHGNFFFGSLGPFPVIPGTQNVYKLTPSGEFKVWASGFTTVLGLALDDTGRLYVLESMTAPGFPGPSQFGAGRVVRVEHSGAVETIYSGLTFPTAMTLGPDGALYVSNVGFGPPVPGLGEIVKIVPGD